MKIGHIIALALALLASHPVYATSRDSEVKAHVVLQQTDPEGIEITSSENRIQVTNAYLCEMANFAPISYVK